MDRIPRDRDNDVDVVVVGGGVIGLATARALLVAQPDLRLALLEKEDTVGVHQTGRNTGVIHSGIFYKPGTLKAQVCREGSEALFRYCEERGVPYERCGKVVIAADESEIPGLRQLHENGIANGVPDLEMIGVERLRELEPHARGVMALHSPISAITNYQTVCEAYADDIRASGGVIRTGWQVTSIDVRSNGVVIRGSSGELTASRLLSCAGLFADRLAAMTGGDPEPRIVPIRGDRWQLRPQARHLCRNLIYPVPHPTMPFSGIHFVRRIGTGEVWMGPNAVLAFAREGYALSKVVASDLAEALRYAGFRALAGKHWKFGAGEMWRGLSKRAFLKGVRRFIPSVTMDDMIPAPSGVRATTVKRNGEISEEFTVDVQNSRVVHVRTPPSPGATASLITGRMIAEQASAAFSG